MTGAAEKAPMITALAAWPVIRVADNVKALTMTTAWPATALKLSLDTKLLPIWSAVRRGQATPEPPVSGALGPATQAVPPAT